MCKVFAGLVVAALILIGGVVGAAFIVEPARFGAPFPNIEASLDPTIIARGEYLVYGPAFCVDCHVAPERRWEKLVPMTEKPPLSGGNSIVTPFGRFFVPNITPDLETGIGKRSDAELARLMRHSVDPDGKSIWPFMDTQDFSDEDLLAVISFLRSRPAVRREVPRHELNLLGTLFRAFFLDPAQPERETFESPLASDVLARGRYLAEEVAQCEECHTVYAITGEPIGERFAGGRLYDDLLDPRIRYSTPNLTPHPATGRMSDWSFEVFRRRFAVGRALQGSPMPWESFALISEDDLYAIFAYLMNLEPVENDTGPPIQLTQ